MRDEAIEKRTSIYKKFRKSCDLERDYGIYFDTKLSDEIRGDLKESLTNYIVKSLKCFYKEDFVIDEEFLSRFEERILNLPNRTPNGAFHPKKENVVEYNILQKNVVKALAETGILENCLAVQPCTVRVVSGKKADLDHNRPLATTKLHSDAWASHVGDAILGCPLLGDPTTSLEFYEPQQTSEDFFLSLENYDDGLKKFMNKEFLGCARMGYLSVFDHACLHKTSLNEGGIRVSFDFGIIVDSPDSLYYNFIKRSASGLEGYRYEYLDLDVYKKLGTNLFISVEETMEDAKNRYTHGDKGAYKRAEIKVVKNLQDF